MFTGIDPALMPLARPEWLALLPLVLLPVIRECLRPIATAPIAAGWQADPPGFAVRSSRLIRWLVTASLSAGLLCAILAITAPLRPVISALLPAQRGHFWAIVLDCSGSMAIVDPGRQASRLRLLADDLGEVVADRPHDRFAVIRVAGYADRVGPAESSSRFLVDRLRQIAPAMPGEDGTNLGDGMVLAADSLPPDVSPDARSILIVSDGRENPPDARSFRVKDVAANLLKSGVRIDWLRLALPAETDESPESKALGEASKQLLENLVRESGGALIDAEPGGDRSAIVQAAIARFAGEEDRSNNWSSASTALVIATCIFWALAFLLSISRSIRNRPIPANSIFRIMALTLAIASAGIAAISAVQASQTQNPKSSQVKSRWLILLDASPSMAAADAAGGSRNAAAAQFARGLIGRLSLDSGTRGAVIRFSGRAIPESGWTDDWKSLESIVEETDPYSIRPTGSDWDVALRTTLEFETVRGEAIDSKIETHVIFLTDGESSREPGEDVIDALIDRKWRTTFVTFGDDQSPGATFPIATDPNSPWIDRRSGKPARSARSDKLAQIIATKTGGRVLSVGSAPFDTWETAEAIAGNVGRMKLRTTNAIAGSSPAPFFLTIASIAFFLIGEIGGIADFWIFDRTKRNFVRFTILPMVCISSSCTSRGPSTDFDTATDSAWAAYRSGNLTQARAILAIASRKMPNEPAIPYDLALIELGRNQPGPALESLDESTRRLENSKAVSENRKVTLQARIEAARGYAQILAGRPDKAVATLTKAIESAGLTEAERADAEKNANYAKSASMTGTSSKPASPYDSNPLRIPNEANADLRTTGLNDKTSQWNRMANEVRNRARVARSRFEPAGDELKSGAKIQPGESETMDW